MLRIAHAKILDPISYNHPMDEIELLYFDGCPSWQSGLENLRRAIAAENLSYQIRLIEITNPQQATDEHFLGSPTFRLNGTDLWPELRSQFDLSCRVYSTPQGLLGSPTLAMLRDRLHVLHASSSNGG
jgi:hypothetical protein